MSRRISRIDDRDTSGDSRPSEARLRALLASGDLTALDALFSAYGEPLMGYLRHLLPDASQCEDAIHDTLLKIFEDGGRERGVRELTPWVFRVARNEALDRLRRRNRRQRIFRRAPAAPSLRAPDPTRSIEHLEFATAVSAALAELPELFRSTFLLREIEALAYEDIATIMKCSTKTVSSRLSRARSMLRDRLDFWKEGDA